MSRRSAPGIGRAVSVSRAKQRRHTQRPPAGGAMASSSSASNRQITHLYIEATFRPPGRPRPLGGCGSSASPTPYRPACAGTRRLAIRRRATMRVRSSGFSS